LTASNDRPSPASIEAARTALQKRLNRLRTPCLRAAPFADNAPLRPEAGGEAQPARFHLVRSEGRDLVNSLKGLLGAAKKVPFNVKGCFSGALRLQDRVRTRDFNRPRSH